MHRLKNQSSICNALIAYTCNINKLAKVVESSWGLGMKCKQGEMNELACFQVVRGLPSRHSENYSDRVTVLDSLATFTE